MDRFSRLLDEFWSRFDRLGLPVEFALFVGLLFVLYLFIVFNGLTT